MRVVCSLFCSVFFLFQTYAVSPAASPLRLGMSAALTGPTARLGTSYLAGARAGFSEANARGGVRGRPIQLVALDDGYDPERTVRNLIQLMDEEKVDQFFGFTGTPTVTRILPLLVHTQGTASLLLFPLTGAYPLSLEPQASHVFTLRASYADEIDCMVERLVGVGVRRFAIVHQADAYGREGWHDLRMALRRYGLDLVAEASFQRNAVTPESDLTEQATTIVDAHPDAVLCMGTDMSCAVMACQLRQAGFAGPLVMPSFVINKALMGQFTALCPSQSGAGLLFCEVVPAHELPEGTSDKLVSDFLKAWRAQETAESAQGHAAAAGDASQGADEVAFEGYLAARAAVLLFETASPDVSTKGLRKAWLDLGGSAGIIARLRGQAAPQNGRPYVRFVTIDGEREATLTDFEAWRR